MADIELERIAEERASAFGKSALLQESSLNRVSEWIKSKECAFITAWRTRYIHTTPNTFKPKHIENGRFAETIKAYRRKLENGYEPTEDEVLKFKEMESSGECYWSGEEFSEGDIFTSDEKRHYNRELKATLLRLGYGVTNVRGVFREEGITGCDTNQEESFLVVNRNGDPNFKDTLFKLSEYYNQDCFMYSPFGSDEGFNIGTNAADWPGYRNSERAGAFRTNVQHKFMSRIGNAGFAFGDREKMKPDGRPSFRDRKQSRIDKQRKPMDERFDTIANYGIGGRRSIYECCDRVVEELGLSTSSTLF